MSNEKSTSSLPVELLLNENSPQAIQPNGMLVPLKPHQLTALYAALKKENPSGIPIVYKTDFFEVCKYADIIESGEGFIKYVKKNIDNDNLFIRYYSLKKSRYVYKYLNKLLEDKIDKIDNEISEAYKQNNQYLPQLSVNTYNYESGNQSKNDYNIYTQNIANIDNSTPKLGGRLSGSNAFGHWCAVRKGGQVGYIDGNYKITIHSNFAMLSDKPGSGKSFVVCGIILSNLCAPEKEKSISTSPFTRMSINPKYKCIPTNLIIVPENIIHQWTHYIHNFTNLSYYVIKNDKYKKDIPTSQVMAKNYKVIIIVDKLYAQFFRQFSNVRFSRIFIDEADSEASEIMPNYSANNNNGIDFEANMIWLITATPEGFIIPSGRDFNRDKAKTKMNNAIAQHFGLYNVKTDLPIDPYVLDAIQVRCDEQFADKSMGVPTPYQTIVECNPHDGFARYNFATRNLLTDHQKDLMNSGNFDQLLKELNIVGQSCDNIAKILTTKNDIKIKNIKKEIENQKLAEIYDQGEHDRRLSQLNIKLEGARLEKVKLIRELKNIGNVLCPVCGDAYADMPNEPENRPTFLTCCTYNGCFKCIIKDNKCYVCNTAIKKEMIKTLDVSITTKDAPEKKKPKKDLNEEDIINDLIIPKDKYITLVNLVRHFPNLKFLVFNNDTKSATRTYDTLVQNNINVKLFDGSDSTKVTSLLKEYKNGKLNVLILDGVTDGKGINVTCTDVIVCMHQMTDNIKTQVIGRANRIGRQTPLFVVYLSYENEIKLNTNCNDAKTIQYKDFIKNAYKKSKEENVNEVKIDDSIYCRIDPDAETVSTLELASETLINTQKLLKTIKKQDNLGKKKSYKNSFKYDNNEDSDEETNNFVRKNINKNISDDEDDDDNMSDVDQNNSKTKSQTKKKNIVNEINKLMENKSLTKKANDAPINNAQEINSDSDLDYDSDD